MPGAPTDLLHELVDVRGRDVLDVGCGEGGLARRLARAGARVVGLDPQALSLQQSRDARAGTPAVRFIDGVAQALPFPDASFDLVVFFNSLHHVPIQAMDASIAEAARVLRRGGSLYVQEPLTEGSAFELLRPVEDETVVRHAAQRALARACEAGLTPIVSRQAALTVRHADFEQLRSRMIAVEPARAAAFEGHTAALHRHFHHLARPVAGGYEFDQPFRVDLFER
ncbi:MAG TPA: class I SAM-dependent methyltransferase [Solirubrobacteraceae bacterium]